VKAKASRRSTARRKSKTPSRAGTRKRSATKADDLDEQYTPTKFFGPLHREFLFTLDACATKESAKCQHYFTKRQNGLNHSWRGQRVWLNPPYSNIEPWLAKVRHELKTGCPVVVALLPAWTDRRWWHQHIERARTSGVVKLRFIKGRIKFGMPGHPEGGGLNSKGKKRGTGSFPSVLVIWQRPGYVVPDPRQLVLV
jgi:phage N-6-adenine-methyltransferase